METVTDPHILQELRKYYRVHSPSRNPIFRYIEVRATFSHTQVLWDNVPGLAERQWKTRMSAVKFPEIYVGDTEHELVIRVDLSVNYSPVLSSKGFKPSDICLSTASKICL